jgi:MoxR-like ATPase
MGARLSDMNLLNRIEAQGYYLRPAERTALRAAQVRPGLKSLIIEGPPGTGKTALGRAVAEARGASEVFLPCHHWLAEEDLFHAVDIGRVATRNLAHPGEAYRPGALTRAILASRKGPVVLVVDELDKAPERVDALLLEFLQEARVIDPFGRPVTGHPENLWVFITSNGLRPLSEPLLRRAFRLRQAFLPVGVEARLLRKQTGARAEAVRIVLSLGKAIRERGASSPSLQEMRNLLEDLRVADSPADVATLIEGWLLKDEADLTAIGGKGGLEAAARKLVKL